MSLLCVIFYTVQILDKPEVEIAYYYKSHRFFYDNQTIVG